MMIIQIPRNQIDPFIKRKTIASPFQSHIPLSNHFRSNPKLCLINLILNILPNNFKPLNTGQFSEQNLVFHIFTIQCSFSLIRPLTISFRIIAHLRLPFPNNDDDVPNIIILVVVNSSVPSLLLLPLHSSTLQ